MIFQKQIDWCKENNKTLIAVGAFLGIIAVFIQIMNSVGITINIPLYFKAFDELDLDVKIYSLSILNFVFTLMIYFLLSSKLKEMKKSNETAELEAGPIKAKVPMSAIYILVLVLVIFLNTSFMSYYPSYQSSVLGNDSMPNYMKVGITIIPSAIFPITIFSMLTLAFLSLRR